MGDKWECSDPYGLGCRQEAVVFRSVIVNLCSPVNLDWVDEVDRWPEITCMVGFCGECCWSDADREDAEYPLRWSAVDLDGIMKEFVAYHEMFSLGTRTTRRNFYWRDTGY